MSFRCFVILSFVLGGMPSLFGVTWYSQSSGVWGDGTGTPGLWNTAFDGSGLMIDGTTAPTSNVDIVIQQSHKVTLVDFSSAANYLEVLNLTVEQDAELDGSAILTISINGPDVIVDGSIDSATLTLESGASGNFKNLMGSTTTSNGFANLQTISFAGSYQLNTVSIDLNTTLNTDFYPFNEIAATFANLTIEKNKTLKVLGSVYLDGDGISNFSINNFDLFGQLDIDGSLVISGNFIIGNNNSGTAFFVNVAATTGFLELSSGAIIGDMGQGGTGTSGIDFSGTLIIGATDSFQGFNSRFTIRMNAGSLCRLIGGSNQQLDADAAGSQYYDVELAGTGPKVLSGDVEINNDLSLGPYWNWGILT